MRKIPVSPTQYMSFELGRLLLVVQQWEACHGKPIEFERALLFDFVVQAPTQLVALLPELEMTLRAHDLADGGLEDLFAKRKLQGIYEHFQFVVAAALARGLVVQTLPTKDDPDVYISLTGLGIDCCHRFISPLSLAIEDISTLLAAKWNRKNPSKTLSGLLATLPDQSRESYSLSKEFKVWVDE